jgi:hypothetical protein
VRGTNKTVNHLDFFLIFIDAQIPGGHVARVSDQFGYGSKSYSISNKDFAGLFIRTLFNVAIHHHAASKLESCLLFF